ncbi:Hypothetical_protein [Hexamita inflata]|uniref:Hypothetical_protein n=1 Tax=Hexamita inflata TaxID=28002 RepID=A0AA86NB07_9EUKA|nr:Hypothetical protein HINF_LOCUS3531 [Hexamita inflata]
MNNSSISLQDTELITKLNVGNKLIKHKTEQKLVNELKNKIRDNTLCINEKCINEIDELQNIEFINNFEIDELVFICCNNLIPKLNNNQIVKLELYKCGIKYLNELILPNLQILVINEEIKVQKSNYTIEFW